jgi:hypothetical protein
LRARRAEIEEAILTRVFAIPDPSASLDPDYAEGLRAAVTVALDYGLSAISADAKPLPAPPPRLLSQARLSARSGVSLDIVLRRYVSGHALLVDFLVIDGEGLSSKALKAPLRSLAKLLDVLLVAVAEEYGRELERWLSSSQRQETETVEGLLAGEPLDAAGLDYDVAAHHLAAVARGPRVADVISELAAPLDCRLLLIERGDGVVWAWLGSRAPIGPAELDLQGGGVGTCRRKPPLPSVSRPEDSEGGDSVTSRQEQRSRSRCALRIASPAMPTLPCSPPCSRTSSWADRCERSISSRSSANATAVRWRRETLRAYFATERNVSSAAALLGVNRHTVANRLRAIEGLIGLSLKACAVEVDAALRLEEFDRVARRRSQPGEFQQGDQPHW